MHKIQLHDHHCPNSYCYSLKQFFSQKKLLKRILNLSNSSFRQQAHTDFENKRAANSHKKSKSVKDVAIKMLIYGQTNVYVLLYLLLAPVLSFEAFSPLISLAKDYNFYSTVMKQVTRSFREGCFRERHNRERHNREWHYVHSR